MSTLSSGVERKVCEDCGHLSIFLYGSLIGAVDRAKFARPADELSDRPDRKPLHRGAHARTTARYAFNPTNGSHPVAHRPQVTALNGSGGRVGSR